MDGTIARLVTDKGFGFIKDSTTKIEYFFHMSGVRGVTFSELTPGQAVSFDEEHGDKGPRATNVRPQ